MAYPSRTLVIPFNGESYKTLVLRDKYTGDVIHASTGEVTETFSVGIIAGVAHDVSGDWVFALPSTAFRVLYFTLYDEAAPTAASIPVEGSAQLYDPRTGQTYTDGIVSANGRLFMR